MVCWIIIIKSLQGMYFVSSVLLMRMNMPLEYRTIITEVLGDLQFNFYHRWFDVIFLISALSSILFLYIAHKQSPVQWSLPVDLFTCSLWLYYHYMGFYGLHINILFFITATVRYVMTILLFLWGRERGFETFPHNMLLFVYSLSLVIYSIWCTWHFLKI